MVKRETAQNTILWIKAICIIIVVLVPIIRDWPGDLVLAAISGPIIALWMMCRF